ncbi:MAG: hypothetical protein OH319_02600 [Candidatus Parvarchaeota archaeon]|nr:hypothetical protein [Candidatus Jingweiarchaeum tengchongense]MCW1298259.1 hypothetical protein [Candidatus Jingweiarchaeum tengchongense]MCW1300056.1 hypothetical protein [Candidatus Jingweiarchaeum tengchongense]MCW1304805.1 hypothetical protein [Candidatus Jingweiarchaeum tengchongense]MCW1305395.1 hypothetical protein [Candidatus Jingweiarchaeum tengchongense]
MVGWKEKHIKDTLEEIVRRCINPTIPLATLYGVISSNEILTNPSFTYGTLAGTAGFLLLGENNKTKRGIRYTLIIPAFLNIVENFLQGNYLEVTKTGAGMLFGSVLGVTEKKLEERLKK